MATRKKRTSTAHQSSKFRSEFATTPSDLREKEFSRTSGARSSEQFSRLQRGRVAQTPLLKDAQPILIDKLLQNDSTKRRIP